MFRKLFGWLDVPITSKETDAAIYLVSGGGSAVLAVLAAITGHWVFAFMFVVLAVNQLRVAWRYYRVGDAQRSSASDSTCK